MQEKPEAHITCQALFCIREAKVSKTDRFLFLAAPVFWLITHVTQLTFLRVRFLTYDARVHITLRARTEFK